MSRTGVYDLTHGFIPDDDTAPEHPQTNADRIRSMSDEELADYFSELSCWPNANKDACMGMANCDKCWLSWLKQEVSAND